MMTQRPTTPHSKRVVQFYGNIIDERDDLFRNVDKITCTAENQIQMLHEKYQASLSKQQALSAFLAKIVSLLSETNCLVLNFLETEKPPFPVEPDNSSSKEHLLDGTIEKLQICYKQDESCNFYTNISNNENQNHFDLREISNNVSPSPDSALTLVSSENRGYLTSPTLCSNGSIQSTSSAYSTQNPLEKSELSVDQKKLRGNMKKISKKMGFIDLSSQDGVNGGLDMINFESPIGSSELIELQEDLTKIPENLNHLDSIIGVESHEAFGEVNDMQEKVNDRVPKIPDTKDSPEMATIPVPINLNGDSSSTGAIGKFTSTPKLYLDTSCTVTMSQKEGCEKVNSWLENKTESLNNIQGNITSFGNVVEKLHQIKRYDRHEAVKEAKEILPDLKLVPYLPPKVESDGSSSGKSRNKKSKLGKDFEIPPMEPPVEGSICIFSHIVSPHEFYVQIINPVSTSNMDLVCESLNKAGQTKKGFVSKQAAQSSLGKYCYGFIRGKKKLGQWFRFQVLDWKLEAVSDEVIVQCIDYGFTSNISYKCLRELTLNLAKIPRLAIKCFFPLLYPIGSTPTNLLSDWSKSTIDILYDMANLNKDPLDTVDVEDVRLFEIVFARVTKDSLAVDLTRVPVDGGDSMGCELIEMGIAKEIIDNEDDPYLAEMLQDVEDLEAADNVNEYITGYDAKDEARVCKFTRADGTCFKGKNCQLEHVQLKDGYTTDKCPTYYKTIRDLILPQKHEEIQVLVTEYIDSCTYTVQMVRNSVNLENSNIIVDKDLADLTRNMNDPKLIGTYVPFKILPAIGELILAYNPIAKKWMRVVVRNFEDIDPVFIEVSPIDFGGDFKICIKNIRKMREEFMHLPCQTFQIYLDNYQHKATCDNMKANKFFEKHIYYKSFIARILTHELPFKVKLMTLKGNDIGNTLVKEGFAEPRTVDRYLSEAKNSRGTLILE